MSTFGTDTRGGVPTAFQFSYNGETKDWGTTRLLEINDVSNQADPIDNKIQISDLTIKVMDSDGVVWSELGNGTSAFNKAFSGTVFVGGTMGYDSDYLGVRYTKLSETGAWEIPFHTGKITNVSKANNIVSIQSQNLMNLLENVKWRLPLNPYDAYNQGSFSGKYSFAVDSGDSTWSQLLSNSGYNKSEAETNMDLYAFPTVDGIGVGYLSGIEGIYDISEGTGIKDTLLSPDVFLNNQFYRDFKSVKFSGSQLGTFRGTITDLKRAKELGWASLAESEAHVDTDNDGTFYIINKMRFAWDSGTADSTKPELYYQELFRMEGDPTAILRHLLFGKMVTPFYTEADSIGNSFDQAARITAFKVFDRTINPNDETVLPYIQDLLRTESSLFYASLDNKFQFEPYGPKNLYTTLNEIGTVDIINSSYDNDINDTYNRVSLKYGWNFTNNEYTKKKEGTLSSWTVQDDRVLDLSSKWLLNDNQAQNSVSRQLARYEFTTPKTTFTTSQNHAGLDIGSLVKVTDSQSGMNSKTIQILDYTKGFGNGNRLTFSGYDGESLFVKRGYAFWDDGTSAGGTEIIVNNCTGTSTSGWGTTILGIGTTLGINEDKFGSQFIWW